MINGIRVFKKLVKGYKRSTEKKIPTIKTVGEGAQAVPGGPLEVTGALRLLPPEEAKLEAIKIPDFKTKRIAPLLLDRQDLILGFEQKHHIDKLKRKFKNLKGLDEKVFLLMEYAGEKENLEIKDPFDLPQDEYNKILKRIEDGVLKTIQRIIEHNQIEELN